jgi:CRISPR-associated endonuclease/helicase Cas3
MKQESFDNWFAFISGHVKPRQWQSELAENETFRSRLIRIPTGLGKTEGVLATWAYYRLHRGHDSWPRRLVWCLPMRVLVEQTNEIALAIADRINRSFPTSQQLDVHLAMGGENAGDWFLYPERPAIIIGTQDMLLSRALNRGYGSSRARWPVEFGLLNHDALWVMDEVQLMDVGLATSAQLQTFRDEDAVRAVRPCATWWMSATLQPEWLKSVDSANRFENWVSSPCNVPTTQRNGGLFEIQKSLSLASFGHTPADTSRLASFILDEHSTLESGEFGRVTLVVCNTVDRACAMYDAVKKIAKNQQIELVHSRFRCSERERWRMEFLAKDKCSPGVDRIIVATQVVEAGVDISAGCLVSELAPWPSLVQRFGRCARYGGKGKVFVIDRGRDEKTASPYSVEQLESASEALQQLNDVGLKSLEQFEDSLDADKKLRLYPYQPSHLLMRTEFNELFDTSPDLTGADLDISRFIRTGDERDLQVFWVELDKDQPPLVSRAAQRDELCSVPFLRSRDWLCGTETKSARKPKLLPRMRAWVWDWIDGNWKMVKRGDLLPGRIVCVAAGCGGYRKDRGFDSESRETVDEIKCEPLPKSVRAANESDREQASESLCFSGWKTIATHSREVVDVVEEISISLSLKSALSSVLAIAAQWHDIGKAHPAFQNMLRRGRKEVEQFGNTLLAKSGSTNKKIPRYFADDNKLDERIGFRHELASVLALFAILETYQPQHPALLGKWSEWLSKWEIPPSNHEASVSNVKQTAHPKLIQPLLNCSADDFDLLLYLVASHHGKVRGALYASPQDQNYVDQYEDGRGSPIRGVKEDDVLPPIELIDGQEGLCSLRLTLDPAALGLSHRTGISWRERCLGLVKRLGPTQLAYLEAILRAADLRASRMETSDPLLEPMNDKLESEISK